MREIDAGHGNTNISRQFDIRIFSVAGKSEREYSLDSRTDGISTVSDAERQVRENLLQTGQHVVTINVQVLRDGRHVQGTYQAQFEVNVPEPRDADEIAA